MSNTKKYLDYDGLRYFLILFKTYMNPDYVPTKEEQDFLEEYLKETT